MHFVLGNSDTLDPTYMYLVAGVIVVIVVLVFVVLMKRPWTYFRVKHKDTELEIGNKPGDAGEVAKRILDQAERNQSLQEQVSELKSENERLKQQQLVTEAVQRVEAEADKGDDQARAAIEEARASGDTEKLQAALISVSDRQADKIKADLTDHIQLCREIAEIAFLRGDIDEAMRRLEVILKADPDDLDATNRLGHIYKLRGELDKAEQAYLRIGELSANDLEGQSISHGNLGSIYIMRGQLDLAEQSISKALAISKELDLNEGVANSYGTLGRIYFENGDYDLAKEMVFESIKLNKQLPRIENLAINYSNLGCIYLACSELLQAEQILRSSLEMNEKLGRLVGMAKDYGNLGQVAKLRGNMPQAREEWTKSRDLFKRIGIPDMVKKVQGWLDGLSNESPE